MASVRLRLLLSCGIALLAPLALSLVAQPGTPVILIGSGEGGGLARELRVADGSEVVSGLPLGAGFTGGVRVAAGDINGDAIPDRVVASGPGGPGQIVVVSGQNASILVSVLPFGPSFVGGVYVATGDVDGDGRADIIAGAGIGGGQVTVLSGVDGHVLAAGFPFSNLYLGGVTVAGGDFNGDGRADIVAGTATGGLVRILNGIDASEIASGFPYGPLFAGGVNVATGDVNGDGHVDAITAPRALGDTVRVFSGADISVLADFIPYPGAGGVNVAAGDINDDGRADIVTGPGAGPPIVKVFDGFNQQLLSSFMALNPSFPGGVFVATLTRGTGPMRFTSAPSGTLIAGRPGTITITTSGGAGTTITSAGALPAGVTFTDNGNGTATLAGTAAAGTGTTYALTLSASRGGAALGESPLTRATQTFTLTVREAPAFTSPDRAGFSVTRSGASRVTTSGFPRVTLTSSGGWPAGVAFADQGDGSALISGIPIATGIFISTITATNALGETATQLFTLTVNEVPPAPAGPAGPDVVFTSATAATWTVGTAHTFPVTTSSTPAAHLITLTGVLPAGVTFTSNGNGTATLAGVPPVGSIGTYQFVFTGINGVGTAGLQTFTLTIQNSPTPLFTSPNAATFAVGANGSFTVTTTSQPPVSAIALSAGALPSGVTFTDNGNGTATLTGTPAAGTAGSYPLTFTASNGASTSTQDFALTVSLPSGGLPSITSANTTTFVVSAPGSFTITTTGTPTPATIGVTGALPGGLTFTNHGNGTATLAGTADAGTAGTYPLVFSATNANGTAAQSFTLVVNNVTSSPIFTSPVSTAFRIGAPGTFAITTVAEPPVTVIALTGTLPAGVTFTDNGNGTATLAGTPTAGAGSHAMSFTATNGVGAPVTQNFTLTVQQAAALTSANSTSFSAGVPGTFTVTTIGTPIPTLVATGALPDGVTFTAHNDGTATLAGTAGVAAVGSYALTFTAINGVGAAADQSFTLTIAGSLAPTLDPIANPAPIAEDAALQTVALAGITAGPGESQPLQVSATSNNTAVLPNPAVSYVSPNATGSLSYTPVPNAFGSALITVTVEDGGVDANLATLADNVTITRTFTVAVNAVNDPPAFTKGADQTVLEDAGAQTVNVWAAAISTGPNEGTQTIAFDITANTNTALFSAAPAVSAAGTLTYTPAPDANGTASITLRITDDGGVANGGINQSATQTFDITITPVNDLPHAISDAIAANEDAVLNVNAAAGLLANDDPDGGGDARTVVAVNGNPANVGVQILTGRGVRLTVNADGSLSYDTNVINPTTIQFIHSLGTGQQTTDTFTYTVQDATAVQSTATVTITVNGVNEVPEFTVGFLAGTTFTEGAAPLVLAPNANFIDWDDTSLAFATVQVTGNYQNGQDVLAFTAQPGIGGNWDATTGTLTLTGPASNTSFLTALASVTYANTSQAPNTAQRSISFTINDGEASSINFGRVRDVTVVAVNDVPVLDLDADDSGGTTGANYAIAFTEDAPAKRIADLADATIVDLDHATLGALTVTLTNLLDPTFEVLDVDLTGADPAFSKAYDTVGTPGQGILIITASPAQPIAAFESLLRNVTYRNTDNDPNITPRTITVVASDGAGNSNTATTTVTVAAANDLPMAVDDTNTVNEDLTNLIVAAPGVLANDDPDGGGDSKTVVAVNGSAANIGLNIFTPKGARFIVRADGSYDYRFISANPALQALKTGEQSTESVTYTMQDGAGVQSTATLAVTVTGVNDAPSASAGFGAVSTFTEDAAPAVIFPNGGVSDDDDTHLEWVSIQLTQNYQSGEDVLAFTNQLGITGNWVPATGTLTLTGPASKADFQTAVRTVTYANTSQAPNTATRELAFLANDGEVTGSAGTWIFDVLSVNDAPSFVVFGPMTVPEDSGSWSFGAIGSISAGAPEEAGQTLSFSITGNTNPGLFSIAPTIGSSGFPVSFRPADNAFGSATITITVTDNGGTANGGVDTFSQTAVINVTNVNDAPVVNNESFDVLGNTELRVDLAAGITPHTTVTTSGPAAPLGLLDNDTDIDSPTLTVTAIGNGCADVSAPFDCTLSDGAVVHVEASGAFSYTPAPGATAGTLSYTVSDGGATVGGAATLNVAAERVWYVKNDGPAGNGTSTAPFNNFAPINGPDVNTDADDAADYIFVFYGNGTNDGQGLGLALEAGQHLIGEFNGLSIPVNLNGNGSPTVLVPQPSATACASGPCRPLITHPIDNVLTAFNAVPAEIAGFRLLAGGNAISLFIDVPLTGTPTVAIHHNVFEGAGADGIDINLDTGTTGTLDLRIEDNTWNPAGVHSGTGVDIEALAGTLNLAFNRNTDVVGDIGVNIVNAGAATTTITGFAGNTIHGDANNYGLAITGATFDAEPGAPIQQVDGGTLVVGSSGNPITDRAVYFQNVRGSVFFDDLDVFSANYGLLLDGPLDRALAFAVQPAAPDGAGTSSITAFGVMALANLTIDLRLQNLTCSPGGNCVSLHDVAGVLRAAPGSTLTKAGGTAGPEDAAFYLDNSGAGTTALTVLYEGTITNTSGTGHAAIVNNADSGSAISFTGLVTDAIGSGNGVALTSNTGATISFTGGLTLATGANDAFTATGGGTVTVVDPLGVASNTITTTTGRALNVSNTTIGAGHLTFERISSGLPAGAGPVNGINLDNTGADGGLIVTGNGGTCTFATPTCTGGTIQSSTGDAIRLVSTRDVSLTRMRIHDNDTNGIYGDELTNFTLSTSVVTDNDVTNPGPLEAGIKFNELYGTASITDTVVRGTRGDNIRLEMSSGALTSFTLTNVTVGPTADLGGGVFANGLSIITSGSGPTITASVSNSVFTGVDATKQQASGILTAIGAGTTTLSVLGSDFDNENIGINLSSTGTGTHRFNVDNNDLLTHRANAINLQGSSIMDGTVNNNRIGAGPLDSGSQDAAGISAIHTGNAAWTLALTNNTLRNTDNEGILVRSGNAGAGDSGSLNVTLNANTVFPPDDNTGPSTDPSGLNIHSRQNTTLCADLNTNASQGNGTGTGYRLERSDASVLRLHGFVGDVVTTLGTKGNQTAGGAATITTVGGIGGPACTVTLPSFP